MSWRRRLVRVAMLVAAIAVALIVIRWLVRYYEPQLAFFPTRGEDATPASYGVPYTPVTVATADGERLRVWHLARKDARAQVVYFHGNGGNLSMWSDVLVALSREGFDVVGFDYRGYGASTGKPTERGLYQDADAVVRLVRERLRQPGMPLIYWGRSLGATLAAYAATMVEPSGVVLEAGFPSMRSVLESNPIMWALSWFSAYGFPTAAWMSQVRAPALVLHGDADSIIPYSLGRRLYDSIPGSKQFVTIKGGDHNDPAPRDPELYWREVTRFVASLKPAS